MTYCLGIYLNDGLVFAADTRTNAGVDAVSQFRKLHVFHKPDDRLIAVLTAGNLATTQSVMTLLEEGMDDADGEGETLYDATSMYDVAIMVGQALKKVQARDSGGPQAQSTTDFSASFIVGGQIMGRRMRLFQVYPEGNFIEATEDTPYLQIGETKYGKPILERVVTSELDLVSAAKCALVSMDSTVRSNLSVAPPIDVLIYEKDSCHAVVNTRIDEKDAYYQEISRLWAGGLRRLFDDLPQPPWSNGMDDRSKG